MANFTEQSLYDFNYSPFQMIGRDWLLITAEKDGKCNTMTASWGGVGIMWNKPVAYIFIRPQRYTKEFVDQNTRLSLSILDGSYRKTLNYLGSVSGRDEDKITKSGLTIAHMDEIPYFDEADKVFLCRKLYAQPMNKESFVDPAPEQAHYPDQDYHIMYVAEIEKLLVKDN